MVEQLSRQRRRAGWDWIGINLDDGAALMAFRIRDKRGGEYWASATHRAADGSVRTLPPLQVRFQPLRRWRSPHTGVEYPVAMRVRAGELVLELQPLMDDQELDSRASTGAIYWEGAVEARNAGRVVGRGYLELTGYAAPVGAMRRRVSTHPHFRAARLLLPAAATARPRRSRSS